MSFVEPTDGQRILLDGQSPCTITLAGTVCVGDPLAYSTGWQRANGTDATLEPVLIAGQSGVSGDKITAYQTALIDFGSGCTATAGGLLYLSDTAGDYRASTGTTEYVIGRQTTAREAYVWGIREISLELMQANSIDSDEYVDGSIDEAHMSANSIDSDSYVDSSIDKAHLADEITHLVTYSQHVSSPDSQTIGLCQVRDACTVVQVDYWTSSVLGSSVGIDLVDGGAAGSGSDVIDACSDNLDGWDVNALTTPYALSAGDRLKIVYDNFTTTPNDTVVTVHCEVILGDTT